MGDRQLRQLGTDTKERRGGVSEEGGKFLGGDRVGGFLL